MFSPLPDNKYPDVFSHRKRAEGWTLGRTEISYSRFSAFTTDIHFTAAFLDIHRALYTKNDIAITRYFKELLLKIRIIDYNYHYHSYIF